MKKFMIGLIVGLSLMFSAQVFAEDGLTKIEAYLRPDLPIQLDGQRVSLESSPIMVDGNTYLKLRDIAKLTGIGVTWNQDTQTVELSTYGNITSPVDSATSPTSNQSTTPSSTTSVVPSSSSSDTVVSNMSNGDAAKMTSDGLPITSSNGRNYIQVLDVVMKYYNSGYDMKYDDVNKVYILVYTSEKGHPTDKYEVKSSGVPVVVINGSSYINVNDYENIILPLIK